MLPWRLQLDALIVDSAGSRAEFCMLRVMDHFCWHCLNQSARTDMQDEQPQCTQQYAANTQQTYEMQQNQSAAKEVTTCGHDAGRLTLSWLPTVPIGTAPRAKQMARAFRPHPPAAECTSTQFPACSQNVVTGTLTCECRLSKADIREVARQRATEYTEWHTKLPMSTSHMHVKACLIIFAMCAVA